MKRTVLAGLLLAASFGLAACENSDITGVQTSQQDELSKIIDQMVVEEVSPIEEAHLKFMREEEKLARDVYGYAYAKYNLKIFSNIQQSEQQHMNAILTLLNKYSIIDPVAVDQKGVFVNQDLQNLYNALIAKVDISDVEALKVGALIEEVDINDLINDAKDVDNQDILYVFNALEKGSENHIRAFVRNLKSRGVTYTPQVLTVDFYNSIING